MSRRIDDTLEKEELYLVTPSIEHENEYREMILEWENEKERIYPGAIRPKGLSYTEWLKKLETYKTAETCPPNFVPSDTYFLVNKYNRILGAISIRHYLNDELFKFGGHIGYGVRPSERRKGYAKAMLKMALEKCKDMNISKVLVTCNKGNIGSARTIMANGGVFENELVEDNGNVVQRYWIEVLGKYR